MHVYVCVDGYTCMHIHVFVRVYVLFTQSCTHMLQDFALQHRNCQVFFWTTLCLQLEVWEFVCARSQALLVQTAILRYSSFMSQKDRFQHGALNIEVFSSLMSRRDGLHSGAEEAQTDPR